MAQKFTVPITVKQLSSASSDAVTVFVDADTFARLKVEAGGRLVWGSGASAGDVNLYRDGADVLRTDDTFKTPTLFVDSIEIDPTGATTDQILKFDGTKFAPATGTGAATNLDGLTDVYVPTPTQGYVLTWDTNQWIAAAIQPPAKLDDIGDVKAGSPSGGDLLKYDSGTSEWKNATIALDELNNVTVPTPTTNDVLQWDGTAWVNVPATSVGATNLDGLTDVVITTPEEFQSLTYNGTNWVNSYSSTVTYVRNAEATTLTTGTVVYLFGATGDHATVKRADKGSDTTSSKTVGLVGAPITASNNGPVVTRGYVDGIDLSVGYSPGDVLWLGSNGAFTKTKSTAPDHLVFVGVVVRATNNGIIYVATQNGYELDELHNVQINGSLASGDFLKYNGTLWVNDPINLGTDTVGNYMSDISAGTGISVTHTPSEGSTGTVAIDTAVVPRLGVTNTFSTNQIISGSTTADLLRITQTGTGNALMVEDDTNPDSTPTVIDAAGRVIVGHTSTIPVAGNSGSFQVHAGAVHNAFLSRWVATASGAELRMAKSRSATVNSFSVVSAADVLGVINAYGDDGTAFTLAGAIDFRAEGTISTGVVPGRIAFYTANSSGTITERMRINSAGEIGIGVSPSTSITLRVMKNITGAVNAYGITSQGLIQTDVTSAGYAYYSGIGTSASASVGTVSHYAAVQGTFDATSAVTTQNGFQVSSGMTGATTNYGFRGALAASGTSRWNLNMDGTAPNYLAGRLGVGTAITSGAMVQITNTTAADKAFVVKGAVSQTGNLLEAQDSAGTALAYIAAGGNYFTTSGGYYSTGGVVLRAGSTAHVYLDTASGTAAHGEFYFRSSSAFTERMRIDSAGNILLGATALRSVGGSFQTAMSGQIFNEQGSSGLTAYTSVLNRNDANAYRFILGKTRGTAAGAVTAVQNNDNIAQIMFAGADGTTVDPVAAQIVASVDGTVSTGVVPGRLLFQTASSAGTITERMRIDSAGQIGIGSVTAAGFGILAGKNITGATTSYGMVIQGVVQSDVTSAAVYMVTSPSTAASSFVLPNVYHYLAQQGTFGAGSSVTTQAGFTASSTLVGATNNYGFLGTIAAATGRYNLYMNGTAANYLAGRLGVGATLTSGAMVGITNTTASDIALSVKGAASQSGVLISAQNSAGTSVFSVNSIGALEVASNIDGTSGYIQIGSARSANGNAYIDLIGDTTYTDYGLRVIRYAGSGAISRVEHRGLGDFQVYATEASPITFHTTATERMRIDAAGNVGIGGTAAAGRTLAITKNITGSTVGIAAISNGVIQSDVTAEANSFRSSVTTVASAFTLTLLNHFAAVPQAFGAGSAVTTQVGFNASASLTGATNNYGFVGDIASGTGRYNLWMSGTADNYILGNTGIGGLPTANIKLTIAGPTANSTNPAVFINGVSGSGSLQLFNDLSAGSYNNITAAGSKGIIAAGANASTSRASFVIAPWSDVAYGIRFEGGATTNIWNRGTTIFQPSATTGVAAVVRGLASQTANLFEVQNSAGTVLAYIASDGKSSFGNAADSDQSILASSIFG